MKTRRGGEEGGLDVSHSSCSKEDSSCKQGGLRIFTTPFRLPRRKDFPFFLIF